MATLKGFPQGSSVSIGVTGKPPQVFGSYAEVLVITTASQVFSAGNKRMNVLYDGTAPDRVEILSQPAIGRVIARQDGGISYDLNEADHTYSGTQTFTYRRVAGSSQTDVSASVEVAPTERPAGWGNGDYYFLETDAEDALVVQPSETARVLYVANDGLSQSAILARHDGTGDTLDRSNVRARDLMNVPARAPDGSLITPVTHYGETADLALTPPEAAKLYLNSLDDTPFRSWWVLYKRGQSYAQSAGLSRTMGESLLHPSYVGAYGTGPKPVFNNLFDKSTGIASCLVFQGLDFTGTTQHRNIDFLIYDDCHSDGSTFPAAASAIYPFGGGGVNQDGILNRGNTIRRAVVRDAIATVPTGGKQSWSRTNGDRVSGIYHDDTASPLFEKIYVDQVAWSFGYRSDQSGDGPKSPDDGSHGIYAQGDLYDVTARDIIITNPSFNALQFRSGTVTQRLFMAYANAGLLLGNGEGIGNPTLLGDGQLANPPAIAGVEKKATHLTYASDIIVTEAGEKDGWDSSRTDPTQGFQAVLAGGIQNQNYQTTLKRAAIVNGGEQGTPISSPTEPGPVGRVSQASETYGVSLAAVDVDASWYQAPDVFRWNWSPSYGANSDATDLDIAALDALSTGGFNDQWKGVTGSTLADFVTSLRAETAPWTQLPALLDYYLGATGQRLAARTAAAPLVFEPAADGSTPGFRADVTDDWSTGDLPGTFAGDSVDLNGYRVFWNISPDHPITDLTFGAGGSLWLRGGDLRIAGSVRCNTAGDTIRVRGGARISASTVTGGPLGIVVSDGRYRNPGTVTGGISVKVVCDSEALLAEPGGAFTLSAGQTLTVGGYAKAGADGQGGDTGTITFAPGARVRFQTGARLACALSNGSKFAVPNARISGDTSGAEASVENHFRTNVTGNFIYKLYDLTGTFRDNETLTASHTLANAAQLTGNTSNGAGRITTDYEATLGQIRTFRSGIHGLAAPDMRLEITLGGTLEIDLAGHTGPLAHTLIAADALSGAFDTVSVLNLGADRDATVTIDGTRVALDVRTGGSGEITVEAL